MSYEAEQLRRVLGSRIRRQAAQPGVIKPGDARAPGGRNAQPAEDITFYGLLGFAQTGGDQGGFRTNPGGEE